MGFFSDQHLASDDEATDCLARELFSSWRVPDVEELQKDLDQLEKWGDRDLMRLDRTLVWSEDTEDAVWEGEENLVEIIREWFGLLRGCVQLGRVTESWRSEDGPVDVMIEIDGREHFFEADSEGNWLDMSLCSQINAVLPPLCPKLLRLDREYDGFVVALTQEQRQRLEAERNLTFHE